MSLLQSVRKANPSAHIIYKPHPDVVAGLRKKGEGEDEAVRRCNEVVTDTVMGELLTVVDEVHVLTSLAGFEALLRGKTVTCYGQPFYAGWGLTHDLVPLTPRTGRLTIDELAAGTLILYPTYVSRTTGQFTTPERALDELLEWDSSKTASRCGNTSCASRFFLENDSDENLRIGAERWSMHVTPLFPNPLPDRLFAGPQARASVRRLPHQLSRAMHVERLIGHSSGKPHPAVTIGSQHRTAFCPIRIEHGSSRVSVRVMASRRKYGILRMHRRQPVTVQRTQGPVMRYLEDLDRTLRPCVSHPRQAIALDIRRKKHRMSTTRQPRHD